MADETAGQQQPKEKKEVKEPQQVDKPPVLQESQTSTANETLPELVGRIMTMVVTDKTRMNQGLDELNQWWAAQPQENRAGGLPNRAVLAKEFRDTLTTVKLVGEALHQHVVQITVRDM